MQLKPAINKLNAALPALKIKYQHKTTCVRARVRACVGAGVRVCAGVCVDEGMYYNKKLIYE